MSFRVGLLVGGSEVARWQAEVVRALLDVVGVEVVVVVVDARPQPPTGGAERLRRLARSPNRLWDAYNNGWVGRTARSLRRESLASMVPDAARLDVVVDKQGWSERFPAAVVEELRGLDLDVLVRFGFGIIRGEVLDAARFGVWSFHHDDEELYRGSPPAFWEIVDGQPVSGVVLQRLTDRLDGGQILRKGWFRTVDHSYVRNTDQVHLGATEWPAALARAVISGDRAAAEGEPSRSTAPVYKKPGDRQVAGFLGRQLLRQAAATARGLAVADHWEIGVVRAPIHRFLDPAFQPRVEWLDLAHPATHYAADPFAVTTDDGPPSVLYERFDRARRIGEIWRAPIDGSQPARPADLPLAGHASYPYVLTFDGRTFCIPQETGAPVRLFELVHGAWEERATLVDDQLLDPTVVQRDGRWWLFATRPGVGSLANLFAWHAPTLLGPWSPHVANPVKSDVRSARPAGTPFVHDGRLFRPAQDCSSGYGGGVALCEVTVLDDERFAEQVVHVVRPSPAWPQRAGLHTLSAMGDSTLLDARRPVFDRHEAMHEARARWKRIRHRG